MRAQTDEDLMTAFELLCRNKEPEKITAIEVAKRAGVTRSTFYNHFADMYDLIETYEDRMLDGIFDILREYDNFGKNDAQVTRKFFSTLCRYVKNSNYLIRRFRTLTTVRFIEKALGRFHGYVERLLSSQKSTPAERQVSSYIHAYALGGLVGILHKWTSEDCADSPEAVAFVLTRIYMTGISMF
ncbi:MAG: TetR/AcrR family transcriptional regulator [Lachnospiraceae bacterium]|nr:TetR/AcrR family transcriptional regulator [Lachnospiraceae bacterium]